MYRLKQTPKRKIEKEAPMKKAIAVFLGILCMLAGTFCVFAQTKNCSHAYRLVDEMTVFRCVDKTRHAALRVKTYVCDACRNVHQNRFLTDETAPHSAQGSISAVCNGNTQMILSRCAECGAVFIETIACPGAPHNACCRFLFV